MQPHIVKAFDTEVENLNKNLTAMANACENQLANAAKALESHDTALAEKVAGKDDHINSFQQQIEEDGIRMLLLRRPVGGDLRYLLSVMKIASELERIGDYAANIARRVTKLSSKASNEAKDLIIEMAAVCSEMMNNASEAFLDVDIRKSEAVWHKDDDIDEKFARMMTLVRHQMQEKKGAIEDCTQLIFMGRCCERIGDHITNIAEAVYYMATGQNYTGMSEGQ